MPPKAKFTREQVIAAALDILTEEGEGELTARTLGARLKSSARPIFTLFKSMKEVFDETKKAAQKVYESYVEAGLKEEIPFKGVGMGYIRFAEEYPKLFRFLFMRESESVPNKDRVLGEIEGAYERILRSIEQSYGVSRETAMTLYLHLWIYTHGIAVLIATKVCAFSQTEISDMLTEVFAGVLIKIKSEGRK